MPRLRSAAVVTAVPALVVVAAVALRAWQLSRRTFYWDDLVIPAQMRETGLWVPYDGHLMPGSAAVQIAADTLAPLQWWLPVVLSSVATAVAGVLWWTLLGRLTDSRTLRTAALTALLFSPFLGTATGWWSAGVNALSWQITTAAVGLLLLSPAPRDRARLMYPAAATVALFFGLLMTEKSLTVVPALCALAVVLRLSGRAVAWSRYTAPAALTVGWAVLYVVLTGPEGSDGGLHGVSPALLTAVVPGMLGGPWNWDRWTPSPAFPATPGPVQVVAVIVAVALVAAVVTVLVRSALRSTGRPRSVVAPAVVAAVVSVGYLVAVLLLLRAGRTGDGSADLLVRGMHYYADWWSVSVLLVTAVLAQADHRAVPDRACRVTAAVLATGFAASSVVSAVTWTSAWSDDDTAAYLAGVRDAVSRGTVVPDQKLPLEILTPLVSPYNSLSHVAGRLGDSGTGRIGAVTADPVVVTPGGSVEPAGVFEFARSEQGEVPGCGIRAKVGEPTVIRVDPALPFGDWTWEFSATADRPVTVHLTTPNGLEDEQAWRARAVDVGVGTDLSTRWVNISGGGGTLLAEVDGPPGAHVCIGAGALGPLVAR